MSIKNVPRDRPGGTGGPKSDLGTQPNLFNCLPFADQKSFPVQRRNSETSRPGIRQNVIWTKDQLD